MRQKPDRRMTTAATMTTPLSTALSGEAGNGRASRTARSIRAQRK